MYPQQLKPHVNHTFSTGAKNGYANHYAAFLRSLISEKKCHKSEKTKPTWKMISPESAPLTINLNIRI